MGYTQAEGLEELCAELSLGRAGWERVPRTSSQPQMWLLFQALRRCQLRHSMALWQLLCAHKSEQLLRLGRVWNPSPSA